MRSGLCCLPILAVLVMGVCWPVSVQAQSDLTGRNEASGGTLPFGVGQTNSASESGTTQFSGPATTTLQPSGHLIRRKDWEARLKPVSPLPAATDTPRWDITVAVGPSFGPGYFPSGWPYGPRVAPPWSYPGLGVGPYVGYPWGFPGYSARAGSFWSNGLSLYGPPVPVYGPIPGVFGNEDLVRQWRAVPNPGFPFGWVGIFAASPRSRNPSVRVWPAIEPIGEGISPTPPDAPDPASPAPTLPTPRPATTNACLTLSIRVPQPTAEVWINDYKTQQTGLERMFESPPLPDNRLYDYRVTVRWQEGGQWRQVQRQVQGRRGEVLRLDFSQSP
jgi:uncharacterized protein (TIGR03000 family)